MDETHEEKPDSWFTIPQLWVPPAPGDAGNQPVPDGSGAQAGPVSPDVADARAEVYAGQYDGDPREGTSQFKDAASFYQYAAMTGNQQIIDQARAKLIEAGGDPGPAVNIDEVSARASKEREYQDKRDPIVAEIQAARSAMDDAGEKRAKQKLAALQAQYGM